VPDARTALIGCPASVTRLAVIDVVSCKLCATDKEQVCVHLPTTADNVTLLAFATDRRAAVRRRPLQQSVDISCPLQM